MHQQFSKSYGHGGFFSKTLQAKGGDETQANAIVKDKNQTRKTLRLRNPLSPQAKHETELLLSSEQITPLNCDSLTSGQEVANKTTTDINNA